VLEAGLGEEGDRADHAAASGTDEGIDLEDPADEPGPSAAKGGRRGEPAVGGGGGGEAVVEASGSAGRASDDVRSGAVAVDQVSPRVGDVREKAGDEIEGVARPGPLVVVAVAGPVPGGLRARREAHAGEADRAAPAVAGESLEGAAVAAGATDAGGAALEDAAVEVPRDHAGREAATEAVPALEEVFSGALDALP